ncbi:UNVERIFIED_CONTAM: hypothetical protein FKN15_017300 [Acipenser sinensis]
MNRNGMVSKIQTRIRTDLFKNNYDIAGKELGRGKFAVVRKCVEKTTGNEHAAKFLRKQRKGEDCRMDIINEIAILELAKSNPYVVALHEVYETTSEIILVLEYAAGGEIFNQCVADNDEAFTENDVIRLVRQILLGVAFLHRSNVVHLDLKPQNLLLTSVRPLGDIRIVDFGLSRRVDNVREVREILGTPEYVAPEILNYEPIRISTDMWSIGVLAYVMLTGESPFLGDNKQETFLNISQVNVDYSQDVFEGVSDLAVDFIKSLLISSKNMSRIPQNLLLTSVRPLGDIRIVDFGLSRRVDNVREVREILGTPEYVAPEILNYEPIRISTDMWSIGVLAYVMLTGESPFLGDNKQETFLNISQVNVDYSQDVFEGVSDLAVDFIKSLLIKNPRKRATAEDCLKHPWLCPHPTILEALSETEARQSQSEPESPDSAEELVLQASYTICTSQSDLQAFRKTFIFEESLPEIQQELVC